MLIYTYEKARSLFCHSFHAIKALALPDKSKRATPIQRQISCNNQNDKKSRVNTNIYSI